MTASNIITKRESNRTVDLTMCWPTLEATHIRKNNARVTEFRIAA